ncbi:MAG: GNAT family N-acetyltransferase [Phycisphaeraceae bacterium]|nr:GNAT family N-acetyltransferase [Phycisphaeraceae bacterium]
MSKRSRGSSTGVSFGPPRNDLECAAFAHVLAHSFGRTDAEAADWVALHDRASIRILCRSGEVEGGLILIHMGQYFNGAPIPMVGIQGVGVAPGARGRGVASELMQRCLREFHSEGTPLSSLYPANQTLYRRLGYEQAGHRFEVHIPLHRIGARAPMRGGDGLNIREARSQGADRDRVRALYRRFAAACQGTLDRNEVVWRRIESPPPARSEPSRLFLIERGRALEGYIFLTQTNPPTISGPNRFNVNIQDMAAITPGAINRLWAFLAGYATVGNDAIWFTGPTNPLLIALPEQTYKPMLLRDHWMLRLVDLKAALEQRDWPRGIDAKLTIDVKDETLSANTGRWSLSSADGRARVRKLDRGTKPRGAAIKCDIGALATLYAGFASAELLALTGRVEGSPDSLAIASALFASTRGVPMLTDMF